MSKANNSSGGIGFTGLLTIVFITLKLCGVIQWSWFWVLSPIIIPLTIAFALLLVMGIIVSLVTLSE
jgi:ABC-type multidrug transport system permease subunit